MQELERYVVTLLENIKPRRYILANSDSCPPEVSLEKFKLVKCLVSTTRIKF